VANSALIVECSPIAGTICRFGLAARLTHAGARAASDTDWQCFEKLFQLRQRG
jgi:hypothetical protein